MLWENSELRLSCSSPYVRPWLDQLDIWQQYAAEAVGRSAEPVASELLCSFPFTPLALSASVTVAVLLFYYLLSICNQSRCASAPCALAAAASGCQYQRAWSCKRCPNACCQLAALYFHTSSPRALGCCCTAAGRRANYARDVYHRPSTCRLSSHAGVESQS